MQRMRFRNNLAAAVAGLIALTSASVAGAQQDPIRIGEINSYTGPLASFTVPYRNGWQLAVEEINAKGGVLGRSLEVISRDDGAKPADAVKFAEELVRREKVDLLAGTFLSHIGLAVADFAKRSKVLFVASEPLSDAIVWAKGNDYTFRLRPSTYMQAAMLAEEAAKTDAKTFATIAPNYAYGKDAVAAFKENLLRLKPDAEFVAEQWPALFKIDAGAEVQAIERAKPDAIYNVTFGPDLAKLVREGTDRGLFDGRQVFGLLSGEPEYLDPLGEEAPEGWIVTGYPWYDLKDGPGGAFVSAYQERWGDYPRLGSIVGYMTVQSIVAALEKAGSTETDAIRAAFEDLSLDTPMGSITYRAIDHQSTMGAYVGTIALRDGKGVMVDWEYKDGANYLPSDEEVKALRPAE